MGGHQPVRILDDGEDHGDDRHQRHRRERERRRTDDGPVVSSPRAVCREQGGTALHEPPRDDLEQRHSFTSRRKIVSVKYVRIADFAEPVAIRQMKLF